MANQVERLLSRVFRRFVSSCLVLDHRCRPCHLSFPSGFVVCCGSSDLSVQPPQEPLSRRDDVEQKKTMNSCMLEISALKETHELGHKQMVAVHAIMIFFDLDNKWGWRLTRGRGQLSVTRCAIPRIVRRNQLCTSVFWEIDVRVWCFDLFWCVLHLMSAQDNSTSPNPDCGDASTVAET